MKTVIGVVLAFALAFSAVPAVASDTFYAFSTLPAAEQASLTPLSDAQLAAIEGEGLEIENVCVVCINVAEVAQANVNTSAASKVKQSNRARVHQSINRD